MKILGIDSSGMVASVALVEDGVTKAEYTINNRKTHSQTLLPMLDEISAMLEDDMSGVDAIAVAAGPGSFTGLRIGGAAVKGLAQAYNKPVIPVPTVQGMAYNLWGTDSIVCPLMDARRNQTYTGIYEFVRRDDTFVMNEILAQCAVPIEDIVEKVNQCDRSVIFLGDGVPVFKEYIDGACKVPYAYAPAGMNRQRAVSVASLGAELFAQGVSRTSTEFAPEYLRLSQAERERNEQSADNSSDEGR